MNIKVFRVASKGDILSGLYVAPTARKRLNNKRHQNPLDDFAFEHVMETGDIFSYVFGFISLDQAKDWIVDKYIAGALHAEDRVLYEIELHIDDIIEGDKQILIESDVFQHKNPIIKKYDLRSLFRDTLVGV